MQDIEQLYKQQCQVVWVGWWCSERGCENCTEILGKTAITPYDDRAIVALLEKFDVTSSLLRGYTLFYMNRLSAYEHPLSTLCCLPSLTGKMISAVRAGHRKPEHGTKTALSFQFQRTTWDAHSRWSFVCITARRRESIATLGDVLSSERHTF